MSTPRFCARTVPRGAAVVASLIAAMMLWSIPTVPAAPIVIGPSDLDDGTLQLVPTVQVVDDGDAVWMLSNGSDRPLTFGLSLHEVIVDPSGRVEAGTATPQPGLVDEITLGPREQGRIAISMRGSTATALRARTVGAGTLEAFAVVPQDGDVGVAIDLDTAQGRAVVAVSADAPTVANLAAGVTGWPGRDLGTATTGPFVIVPPGVNIVVDFAGAVGPTAMEVAVTTATGQSASAEVTTFVVTRSGLAVVAIIALLVASGSLVLVLRRRGRIGTPPSNPTAKDLT